MALALAAQFNVVKFPIIAGGLLCFFAVGIGAFGAHALSELLVLNQRTAVFELANRYQFYHGLALILFGVLAKLCIVTNKYVATLMLIGTLIFSGSLYLLAITSSTWLGAITPIGGVFLLLSWLLFVLSTLRCACSEADKN